MSDRVRVAIARLRRIVGAVTAGDALAPGDAAWLGAAIGRYINEASAGVTLEDAFDLTPPSGQAIWWRVESRERRNAAIRELRERHFATIEISKAAREIVRLLQRVSRDPSTRTEQEDADLAMQAVSAGASMLGPRQVTNILSREPVRSDLQERADHIAI